MTNSSHNGCGIDIMMNAKVELMNVTVKGCGNSALRTFDLFSETTFVATRCEFANSRIGAGVEGSSTSAKFNNCVFHDNEWDGIIGDENATIHLHGEGTAIYSNGRDGILASHSVKVIIHLPSHHNTSYDNRQEDRKTTIGGTITNVED